MSDGAPYSALGDVLDEIARKRSVRGPYNVAKHVKQETGDGPGGSHWSQIFYGKKEPSPRVMKRFALAFRLDVEEEEKLATAYLFRGVAAAA